MKVTNVHERRLDRGAQQVGTLLDSLASPSDALWPRYRWPPMKLDRPLQVGARGGHGPVRYYVAEYEPGRLVRFRFTYPKGFHGFHQYRVLGNATSSTLRHCIEMRITGAALVTWPLFFRPLHNALLEDSLDKAESVWSQDAASRTLSPYVRLLRRLFRRRR